MENYHMSYLLRGLAEFVRAMGMQAENQQRECCGKSMAYDDSDFTNAASQIDGWADRLIQNP